MAACARALAESGYSLKPVWFDEGGVACGPVATRWADDDGSSDLEFELGISVLLSRCDVVLIVCPDSTSIAETTVRLGPYSNAAALVALIPVRGGDSVFFEIDPSPKQKDEAEWLVVLRRKWEDRLRFQFPLPPAKRTILGLAFPILYSGVIRRRFETIKKQKVSEAERCNDGLGLSRGAVEKLEEGDRALLQSVVDTICPFFIRADELGKHYSNVFRTACLLMPLFIAFSTVLAAAAALTHSAKDILHLVEGALLLAAAVVFIRSRIFNHHRKWVENRLLTELLRPLLINAFFLTMPKIAAPIEDPDLWIDRSGIVLRYLRCLPLLEYRSPKKYMLSARISAIADFCVYQASWHRSFAEQHRTAEKWISRASLLAFISTLVLCVLQLVIGYYSHGNLIPHILMMLTLTAACCAFVLLLISHQLGLETIAERSANAAENFQSLYERIDRSAHTASAKEAYLWADECAGIILAEQHSWYRQMPLIRMHL